MKCCGQPDHRLENQNMNHYQKVIVCIIRTLSVGLMLHAITGISMAMIMLQARWTLSLIGAVPLMVTALLLFPLAVPLARLITLGIRDD